MSPEALPREWSWRVLQDIGKIVTGNTPSTSEPAFWGGSIPFVTPTDLGQSAVVSSTGRSLSNEGAARARLLPPRSVLVTCIASIGKNALASTSCCTNQQINAVVCNESAWPEYIYYGLCYRTAELQRIAGATAVSIVSKGKFEQFGLPLPPLPEQRKIAAILSSVDEAIEGTQAVIDQLQVVKKAMMADLLTRGIPGRHKKFKITEIGELPEDWEVVPVERWLRLLIDYRGKSPPKAASGIPLITAKNVREGFINADPREFISADSFDAWMTRGLPDPGDVLFTTEAPLGKVALVPKTKIALGQRLVTLCPQRDHLDPTYLMWVLMAPAFQDLLRSKATGSTVQGIKQSVFRTLPIPIPPLDEQVVIARVLLSVADQASAESACLDLLRTAKSALMAVLLTGEVRVRVAGESAV